MAFGGVTMDKVKCY